MGEKGEKIEKKSEKLIVTMLPTDCLHEAINQYGANAFPTCCQCVADVANPLQHVVNPMPTRYQFIADMLTTHWQRMAKDFNEKLGAKRLQTRR